MIAKKLTNKEVKRKNRNDIFRYMCRFDSVSNPDIAYGLQLSLPTVTQNTKELLEAGYIQESGTLESTGGRRAKALSVCADIRYAIGIDITQNHVGILLTNILGKILFHQRIRLPFQLDSDYFSCINQHIDSMLDANHVASESVLGIGISFPGIIDFSRKTITDSHALRIKQLPFSEIEQYFSYPCKFSNDANAGAFAEGMRANTSDNFFYLSLSNTVGGSIFYKGHFIDGNSFRCGEAGHMTLIPDGLTCYCGKKGCLDAYCSAAVLSDLTDGKLERFFEQVHSHDVLCSGAWNDYIHHLTIAINNIHTLLDCDIILGGYVGSYLDEHIELIRQKVLERNIFEDNGDFIKTCNYKIAAAPLGAALNLIEQFIDTI